MASALDNLAAQARRRFLLAYMSREFAWRAMIILLVAAMVVALGWSLWLVAIAALALLVDWGLRWSAPGPLAATVEVDRQFKLKELISTGWLARNATGLAAAAREQAESAAGRIDPTHLNPGRWGLRYWAICLLLAGVIVAIPKVSPAGRPKTDAIATARSSAAAQPNQNASVAHVTEHAEHQRPPIGEASSDFASGMSRLDEAAGPGKSGRNARSDTDSRGAGAGLATGGQISPAEANGERIAPSQTPAGEGLAGAGA
jgi:hypothetical protein